MIKNFSTYWLPNMLEWRDFMIYIARSQGDRIFKLGGIIGDRSPWHGTKEDLQAWKEGHTGEGLVDAGMKELLLTGYMSMRARHIVATYLIYDLGVDWRLGAAHFEEHLLDYDPALNWVMWMQAPGLLGRGGRHQGLLQFSVKKSVASQKKQLSHHAPDREYMQHWLHDQHQDAAANSSSDHGALQERLASDQRLAIVQGESSTARSGRDDIEDNPESKSKRRARIGRFSGHSPVQFSEAAGKGKGRHRGGEHAADHCDFDIAKGSRKGRWRRREDKNSYYGSTALGA